VWLYVWARCRFAYGPADATATHYISCSSKCRLVLARIVRQLPVNLWNRLTFDLDILLVYGTMGHDHSSPVTEGQGLCVRKVYCGNMADWIRMPFGMVSGVGRGIVVLDGVHMPQGEGEGSVPMAE